MFEALLLGKGSSAPIGGAWLKLGGSFPGRYAGAGAVSGGKIYLFGGYNAGGPTYYNDMQCYDPALQTWSAKATGPAGRYNHVMVECNGYLYLHGGVNGGGYLSDMWRYDPVGNTWLARASTGSGGRDGGAMAAVGTKIYAVCGYVPNVYSTEMRIYDTVANTWSLGTPLPATGRSNATMVAIGTKLYLYAGQAPSMNDLWCFDTVAGTWTQLADGPSARTNHTATVLNGKMYMHGGSGTVEGTSAKFYSYDPNTNLWTTLTASPTGSQRSDACLVAMDGKIYLTGGYNPPTYPTDIYQFTP
jgi:N-acetylneuraminic acid mutarotase